MVVHVGTVLDSDYKSEFTQLRRNLTEWKIRADSY